MPTKLSLLLVGLTDETREEVERVLLDAGYVPTLAHAHSLPAIDAVLASPEDFDLILCEDTTALSCIPDALDAVHCVDAQLPLLILLEEHDSTAAADAIKAGVSDWIVTHHLHQRLPGAVDRALRQRRRTEEFETALAESRRRYQDLAEALPQVVFELDANGRFTYFSQRGLDLFGYTREDLERRPLVTTFIAEDERSMALGRLRGLFSGQEPVEGAEYTAVTSDGTKIPSLIYSAPVVQNGRVVGARGILMDMRAIRETEQQLRASEERYRRLVETMGDGLVVIGAGGIVTFANQAFLNMLELSTDEVLGRDVREVFGSESAGIVSEQIARRFGEGIPGRYELTTKTRSGRMLTLLVSATPLRDNDGRITDSLGVITDITERKQQEERNRLMTLRLALLNQLNEMLNAGESVDRIIATGADGLRDALQAQHVHVFTYHPGEDEGELVMQYSNLPDAMEREVFGKTFGERKLVLPLHSDSPISELYRRGEMLEVTEDKMAGMLAGISGMLDPAPVIQDVDIIHRIQMRYLCLMPLMRLGRSIGHLAIAHEQSVPFSDLEKDLIHAFAEQMATILDKARVEREITRLNSLLQAIIDNAATWFAVVDENEELIIWNRAAAEISGYSADGLPSLGELMRALYPDDDVRAEAYAQAEAAFSGERVEFESSITRADDRIRRIAWHVQSFQIGDGGRTLVIIGRDITERRELQEQLRRVQRLDAVGTLAGGIAHDFNNVLTAISGHSELLAASAEEDSKVRWHTAQIARNCQRASRLTRQLLAFSRKQPAEPQVIDLNRLIRDMEEMFRRVIPTDIDLQLDLGPDLGYTEIDRSQVEQIVMNVVLNARDAMPDGGELRVATRNATLAPDWRNELFDAQPGSYVTISVSDTGIGMDAETEARIFEPFFTTKQASDGTGLGLSTVYGLVRQNRGLATVYSEPGQGTLFRVYLPRVDTTEGDKEAAAKVDVEELRGDETLMVVEDAENLRDLIAAILKSFGYSVHIASNGREALVLEDQHRDEIDLVITDVVMPEMSGTELADQLIERRPELRVLFISGYPNDRAISAGRHDRRFSFLQKPFSAAELTSAVRGLLDG